LVGKVKKIYNANAKNVEGVGDQHIAYGMLTGRDKLRYTCKTESTSSSTPNSTVPVPGASKRYPHHETDDGRGWGAYEVPFCYQIRAQNS
jgi:hypothetical protein